MRRWSLMVSLGLAAGLVPAGASPASAAAPSGGSAVYGDFNGDGRADLAVGVPFEDLPGAVNGGAVNVLYGSSEGITDAGDDLFVQNQGRISGVSERGDLFGYALAAGDFNGNGKDDLAIGVPGEDGDRGVVVVLRGRDAGLTTENSETWHQNVKRIKGTPERGDQFGRTLAAADFNRNGKSDLAVGVPFEDLGRRGGAGVAHVIYGSESGLRGRRSEFWHQDRRGVRGQAERLDHFSLGGFGPGHYDGGPSWDLAIGVPHENESGSNAGAVNVLYGSKRGLTAGNDDYWHQKSPGIPGAPEADDQFGFALASGTFDSGSRDDLGIGAPGEDNGAGKLTAILGSKSGLRSEGATQWTQNEVLGGDSKEEGDRFGTSLASGDFDSDGFDDVGIGTPLEDVGLIAVLDAGAVDVLRGSESGLTSVGSRHFTQAGVMSDGPEQGDRMGRSVLVGNFGMGQAGDLAVGVPEEDIETAQNAGAVNVLYGNDVVGLQTSNSQFWHQDAGAVEGEADNGDTFGWALG